MSDTAYQQENGFGARVRQAYGLLLERQKDALVLALVYIVLSVAGLLFIPFQNVSADVSGWLFIPLILWIPVSVFLSYFINRYAYVRIVKGEEEEVGALLSYSLKALPGYLLTVLLVILRMLLPMLIGMVVVMVPASLLGNQGNLVTTMVLGIIVVFIGIMIFMVRYFPAFYLPVLNRDVYGRKAIKTGVALFRLEKKMYYLYLLVFLVITSGLSAAVLFLVEAQWIYVLVSVLLLPLQLTGLVYIMLCVHKALNAPTLPEEVASQMPADRS